MKFTFEFKGGIYAPATTKTCKFLFFLVSGGKEIPFSQAKKFSLITSPLEGSLLFETECPFVKVMLYEFDFGKARFFYPFYLQLGKGLDGQVVTIRPRNAWAKATNYYFKAEGHFLSKKQAFELLEDGIPKQILMGIENPPVSILKECVSITKTKEAIREETQRRLRIRKGN